MSVPVMALNSSMYRWCGEPGPLVANDSLPGLALAYLTRSATDFTGNDGVTTSTNGTLAISASGTKSLPGS